MQFENVDDLRQLDIQVSANESISIRPEEQDFFAPLLLSNDQHQQQQQQQQHRELSRSEKRQNALLRLILRLKNGSAPTRKQAQRVIVDKAASFGCTLLFDTLLSLLEKPWLEDGERHILTRVLDRLLFKFGSQVAPFTRRILIIIQPSLIEMDNRMGIAEGREVIANLSKAVGLKVMINSMLDDLKNTDESIRTICAQAFAVIGTALGVRQITSFLKAACRSEAHWQARHTGVKIIRDLARMMGCGILAHLDVLVECIEPCLSDEDNRVRIMTGTALAELASASAPYGIEAFEPLIRELAPAIHLQRGRVRTVFLQAMGNIIPLMDHDSRQAQNHALEILPILEAEMDSDNDDTKRVVLKALRQCCSCGALDYPSISPTVLPGFFRSFWTRRMALDTRNASEVVATTVELARLSGAADILERFVQYLQNESEPMRCMAMDAVRRIVGELGVTDVDTRLETLIIDGSLIAFEQLQKASSGSSRAAAIITSGIGTIVNVLQLRMQPHLMRMCSSILYAFNSSDPPMRMHAADLFGKLVKIMHICEANELIDKVSLILCENFGEEYPDVLGSIIQAVSTVVDTVGTERMVPPISETVTRLTPIIRNRHDKVLQSCMAVVGTVAERGPEHVSTSEWMRICFELVDVLESRRKSTRRAAISTIGSISRAVGPQEVLTKLLANLRVSNRQMRVCTTVAIAIVADMCFPFTVIPVLVNEYRIPEQNIQSGVLKAIAFLFEYVGDSSRDYTYSVTTLAQHALSGREDVHRQQACDIVRFIAMGTWGHGREDALCHLLNFVWPNIFEEAPHLITRVMSAIDALRLAVGPGVILKLLMQGLFHPAKKVRLAYWRVYNQLYLSSQDSLVPFYPNVSSALLPQKESDEDSAKNQWRREYHRHELDLFI
ncbi:ARM repeat-containing protein [Ramicandelaber brevisporus]|nr:ARM repeat-containing protein [Ramicandelaber brevisporus]